jgi:hypothetical protein
MTLGKIDISCSRSRNAWGGLLENFQPFPAHRVDDRRGHDSTPSVGAIYGGPRM